MFRKMIFGAVAMVAVGFGAQAATAGEPVLVPHGGPASGFHHPRVDCDFVVFIQHRHGHWERYGRYDTLHEAQHAERRLEHEGYRVRIEEVRDRGDRRW